MADNSAMRKTSLDQQTGAQRERVREMINSSGIPPATLSRAIGRGKDYIADFLKGRKESISSGDLMTLMKIIQTGRMADFEPKPDRSGKIPIYAGAEGGGGCMVIQTDPVDYVSRPWYFEHVPEAYGVLIIGESMSPAFEPGDMAMVNPKLPPLRGKDAIFIASEDEGDFRAAIKRFIRSTDTDFIAEQFNPPKELKLSKREWLKAYRIVGRYSGS